MTSPSARSSAEWHRVTDAPQRLRVALLAGSLGKGGAEKQLVYMTRALRQSNVTVHVYSLRRHEFYEAELKKLDVQPFWIGRRESPLLRLGAFVSALRTYKPHIIQSGHFFTSLYVALAGRMIGACSIGSIRSDGRYELEAMGRWGPWLLRLPGSIIANSHAAVDNLKALGLPEGKCHVVPNVIDLPEFDACRDELGPGIPPSESPVVVTVGSLDRVKRLDRFLAALALAKESLPRLRGIIIGDGPQRSRLETVAGELGLFPHGLRFLGRRHDVPVLLRQADIFVLTSDHEGFPNVLLEAMAARLPVVTTPAGDAARVVQDGVTGFVVPFDDVEGMAQRMLQLASSPPLRQQFGESARQRVGERYGYGGLAPRLLATYRVIAEQQRNRRALQACPPGGISSAELAPSGDRVERSDETSWWA